MTPDYDKARKRIFDLPKATELGPDTTLVIPEGNERRSTTLDELSQTVADMAYDKLMQRLGTTMWPAEGN